MGISYPQFLASLKSTLGSGVQWETYGSYSALPLVSFSTRTVGPFVYVTSGFSGDETLGPMTFLHHGNAIVQRAREAGVGLRVYPCTNPSSWEVIKNRYHHRPNAFIEYQDKEGDWKPGLRRGADIREMRLRQNMSPETRALATDLAFRDVPYAALGMHQDVDMGWKPVTYAHVFGDPRQYHHLMRAASKFGDLAVGIEVNDCVGGVTTTDDMGLVQASADGTMPDYFFRRGAPYSATLETSLGLPMFNTMGVNLIWLMGFIDVAGKERDRWITKRKPSHSSARR